MQLDILSRGATCTAEAFDFEDADEGAGMILVLRDDDGDELRVLVPLDAMPSLISSVQPFRHQLQEVETAAQEYQRVKQGDDQWFDRRLTGSEAEWADHSRKAAKENP